MINCVLIIVMNLIYFVCNRFPKHIIEFSGPNNVFATIVNLLYFIIYFMVLIIAFSKSKTIFSEFVFSPFEKFAKRFEILRLAGLIVLQIAIDLIAFYLTSFDIMQLYILDTITFVQWILIYLICANKETNFFKKLIPSLLTSLAIILIFAASMLLNDLIVHTYPSEIGKYSSDANLSNAQINREFLFEIKSLLLDTLLGISLIVSHFLVNKEIKQKEGAIAIFSRIVVIFVIAFPMLSFKYLLLPYQCIKNTTVYSPNMVNSDSPANFYAWGKDYTATRLDEKSEPKAYYNLTKHKIVHRQKEIKSFFSGNDNLKFKAFLTDNISYDLYGNEAICYLDNSEARVVLFKELYKTEKDGTLLEITENIIQNQNWEAFEYAAEYLYKYSPQKIEDMLVSLSNNEFTNEQLSSLNEFKINPEYIQKISKKILG